MLAYLGLCMNLKSPHQRSAPSSWCRADASRWVSLGEGRLATKGRAKDCSPDTAFYSDLTCAHRLFPPNPSSYARRAQFSGWLLERESSALLLLLF